MSILPEKIAEIAASPRRAGECPGANAIGRAASFLCGSSVRFAIRVGAVTMTIEEARYQTNGCGFLIAAAESICESVEGRQLTELAGAKEFSPPWNPDDIPDNNRSHCFEMALESFRTALADHRQRTIEEFTGEKALICTCFGVAEETIQQLIDTEQADSVERVGELCNAGSGCGSCQRLIQEMIDWSAGVPPA